MRKKKIKDNRIKNIFSNQKGMALLTTLIFVFILVTFVVALLTMTSNDTRLSALQRDSTKAFYIAEAGIEKTLYDLKKDFESSQNWNDGSINGYTSSDVDFGGGTYTVTLTIINSNNVTIKSKGKYYNSIRYVQVDAIAESLSMWDNAVFAGAGASGKAINGNVDIRGSVHILGEELNPDDPAVEAIDITGTAGIGNNYDKMDPDLRSRITAPPTTEFNGETIETLNAKLRVKNGKVNISGNSTVGDLDKPGNGFKETMDGVYVTDGFGGTKGENNVYSDNGTDQPYDFEEGTFNFTTLDDDYINPDDGTSTPGYSYKNYYDDNGLPITESVIDSTVDDFTYSDGKGNSIHWEKDIDGKGKLTISGIIVIDGNFSIGNKTKDPNGYIYEYSGTGTIVSKGDISIHGNLLAKDLFPTSDALGLVAYYDIKLATRPEDSQLKMIGAFYAENQITSAKQNEIAGTFVSKYFDMGDQVPSIYQVPELINNIPPGMPGANITYSIHTSNWHEVYQ